MYAASTAVLLQEYPLGNEVAIEPFVSRSEAGG